MHIISPFFEFSTTFCILLCYTKAMKTIIQTLVFAVAVLLLTAAAQGADTNVERDYEIALTKGQYEIELGNFKAAIGFLEKALKLKPGDQEAQVSLGIALARAGDLARARSELQQAADRDPNDGRARYELALVMEKLGDKPGSRAMMTRAAEVTKDNDLRAAARGFLHEDGEAGGASLRVAAGMQYDSNVILEQDNPIAPSPDGKSNWRGVIVVNGTLPFWTTASRGGEAGYQFYQSLHLDLEDFNVQQHAVRLGGHAAVGKTARFDLDYAYIHSFVGGEKYSTAHRVAPRLSFTLTSGSTTEVRGTYESKKFFNTPVFTNLTDKDGSNIAVGAVHTMKMGKNTALSIAYTYDQDSTKQTYWDYTGHQVRANAMTEMGDYKVFAGLSYYDRKYDGVPPGAMEKRHDGAQEALIGVSRKAGKRVTVSLSDSYTFNDSNLPQYEYSRNIAGFFVEMTL